MQSFDLDFKSEKKCQVVIGAGALAHLNSLEASGVALVADRSLTALIKKVQGAVKASGTPCHTLLVSGSESVKSFKAILPIYAKLLKWGLDRRGVILALGGGSVGDAAGFVAATYLRGVEWVGLPTTLLSQVDSCLGGKTAVNHPLGKNLIGSFHQPRQVICDVNFLNTLPPREILSGLGEAVKYGLIYERGFFEYVVFAWGKIMARDPQCLTEVVRRSLEHKARVVMEDERDLSGIREALNFGHTFGHGFEKLFGYGRLRHGEAVLWGMKVAVELSYLKGGLPRADYELIEEFYSEIALPRLPGFSLARFMKAIANDKKKSKGRLRFILISSIGRPFVEEGVSEREIGEGLKRAGVPCR